ncbi:MULTISPECIES: hypothetical protein [Ruegeria]|uniref:hypothetical protein n=1 Tax=Ruegeria TaxID=97050 RepID=UPI001481CD5B|nr:MULTISPECIES: hypothetical protein [Ruegeria]NOD78481.1 hypothetical protein [Ruegeria sp. HKCCD4332]UUV08604.1 hypothetical protein NOR97_20040 [Ruegeria sp. YS9]
MTKDLIFAVAAIARLAPRWMQASVWSQSTSLKPIQPSSSRPLGFTAFIGASATFEILKSVTN